MKLEFQERHITPHIQASSVQEKIEKALAYRDCAVFGRALMEIMDETEEDLASIELKLRLMNSTTFLLAVPVSKLPANQKAFCFKRKQEMPFWVWIEVNGILMRDQMIQKFGIYLYPDQPFLVTGENLLNLKNCGFITLR